MLRARGVDFYALVLPLTTGGARCWALGARLGMRLGLGLGLAALPLHAVEVLGPEAVVAGPWFVADPAGGWRVGLLLVPPLSAAEAATIPVRGADGTTYPLPCALAPVDRGGMERQTPYLAAVWHLPAGLQGPLTIGGRAMTVPAAPPRDRPVRVAVAGARSYPATADFDRVAKALGGPVDAVLLLGRGLERRLGTSDWEAHLPALIVPPDHPAPGLVALLGGTTLTWTAGLAWGPLGIARLDDAEEPALTVGRLDRPWRILTDAEDRWDLGLLAPVARRDPLGLRRVFAQTARSQVPLILAGGSPSGFLSEPLTTDAQGHLQATVGGTRYAALGATGDGCIGLPPEVALPLDQPVVAGLAVTPRFFTLVLVEGERAPLKFTWVDASDDGLAQAGPGWGSGDGHALLEAWRQAMAATPVDTLRCDALAQELIQLPRRELAKGDWEVGMLFDLAQPAEDRKPSMAARALARRLVADVDFLGDEPELLARLPSWLRRDALLRWFLHADDERRWAPLAATSQDVMIVRALLSQVERTPDSPLLALLVERLSAQAKHTLPIDRDPLIQARLTAAVFGAATLSPTPLRAIARDLRDRVEPVARPPIDRFLSAKGRYRDPDQ